MVDLDLDLDLAGDGAEAAELSLLVIVVAGVELGVLVRQLHGRDQQVVLKWRGIRSLRQRSFLGNDGNDPIDLKQR